ncbi:forkhead box N3, partial [Homo sapiens]
RPLPITPIGVTAAMRQSVYTMIHLCDSSSQTYIVPELSATSIFLHLPLLGERRNSSVESIIIQRTCRNLSQQHKLQDQA